MPLCCASRAIGVLVYEMLFGMSPFSVGDNNQLTTFKNIIQVGSALASAGCDGSACVIGDVWRS